MKTCAGAFALCLFAALAAPQSVPTVPDSGLGPLTAELQRFLQNSVAGFDGALGIYVKDLSTGREFAVDADTVFPTASAIKIAVLAEFLRQAQAGKLNLGERVDVRHASTVGGSGVLLDFADGQSALSLHDLAVLMIVVSDNSATNLLLDRVGIENVNAMLDAQGLHRTRLNRRMLDLAAQRANRENVSTPRELAALLELLWRGKILDPAHTSMALEILRDWKDTPFRRGLPDAVPLADKDGQMPGVRCDAGIVFVEGAPYVIAVMASYAAGDADAPLTAISRRVFSYFDRVARSNAYGARLP